MLLQKKMRAWLPIALILAPSLLLTGCGGSSSGGSSNNDASDGSPSAATQANLEFGLKTFNFNWVDINDATYYKLLERPDQISGYVQVGDDIPTGVEEYTHTVALYNRVNASYILQSCNDDGCTDSDAIYVTSTLDDAIGYVKASNTREGDQFGFSVALSGDGTTLAVGAYEEDSGGANCLSESDISNSGAVYVFRNSEEGGWAQEACVKPSVIGLDDEFGYSVSLNSDGTILAVGSRYEDTAGYGVNPTPNNSFSNSGAAYVFRYESYTWGQEAFIKASNTGAGDYFGISIALSSDGTTLAVGATYEDSSTTGINPTTDNDAGSSGAAYVFRYETDTWEQEAFIKASNTGADDRFGNSISLNSDGSMLAIGAYKEDSTTTGINSTSNDSGSNSGAAYLFRYENDVWSEEAYIKASNSSGSFGYSIALSPDGSALAVGAPDESTSGSYSGAAYLFRYDSDAWTEEAYLKATTPNAGDYLGMSVTLNADGTVLAAGAHGEDSSSTGIGSASNNDVNDSGAAYVFNYDGSEWTEKSYIKANNTGGNDYFGRAIALSDDGEVLAVGAYGEDSLATGVNGAQNDNAAGSGSVYLY